MSRLTLISDDYHSWKLFRGDICVVVTEIGGHSVVVTNPNTNENVSIYKLDFLEVDFFRTKESEPLPRTSAPLDKYDAPSRCDSKCIIGMPCFHSRSFTVPGEGDNDEKRDFELPDDFVHRPTDTRCFNCHYTDTYPPELSHTAILERSLVRTVRSDLYFFFRLNPNPANLLLRTTHPSKYLLFPVPPLPFLPTFRKSDNT